MSELTFEQVCQAIEDGQRLRGWIANGYAQVEYLLGDIITKAATMPEYVGLIERLPHRVDRRIALVKSILDADGFFSTYRDDLNSIMDAFKEHHETRNLFAHGFCTAHHTPTGDFGLEFRKWHRSEDKDCELTQTFRLADLDYERAQIVEISQKALQISLKIHDELGLVL